MSDLNKEGIDSTENTLKFGLFVLSLQYFRSIHFLRKIKHQYSGLTNTNKINEKSQELEQMSNLSKFIVHELKNRSIPLREKKLKEKSAIKIQAFARGWIRRRLFVQYQIKKTNDELSGPLLFSAAIDIQRIWRGYNVRKKEKQNETKKIKNIEVLVEPIQIESRDTLKIKKNLFKKVEIQKPDWLKGNFELSDSVKEQLKKFLS